MNYLGIAALSDPLLIARRRINRSVMASSYDRRGGNHDWSNYIRREGRAAVMMDQAGPGCITRIWTADPQNGTIRIWIDGEIYIECPFARLFDRLPLSFGIGGESPENYSRSKAEQVPMGHTSYCPISFQQHCKVTIEPEDDYLYYHINADLYPPGAHVEPADTSDAEAALRRWESGQALVDMSAARVQTLEIAPGADLAIFDFAGAGVIRGLRIRLAESPPLTPPQTSEAQTSSQVQGGELGGTDREERASSQVRKRELAHILENVWIVAHFDDDEARDPSIRAPLGPFFLDYGQSVQARSLLIWEDEGGYYCFYPMPHQEKASVKIVNRSILPVKLEASVLHEVTEPDHDLLRFRASWHVETPFGPDHRDYEGLACRLLNLDGFNNVELLNAFGGGHFVGCGFNIDLRDAPTDRAAGEGDEMFFIDDDPRLTMYGTGTEDYVNDAWGIRGYCGPFSGDDVGGEWGQGPQIFGYRLHVPDPVPFTRHGRFTLEHGTGNNCSGLYKSVAYWYMDPSLTRTRAEEWQWEAIRTGKRKMNEDAE